MKNTALHKANYFVFAVLIIGPFVSCHNPESRPNLAHKKEQILLPAPNKTAPKSKLTKRLVPLTDENLVTELTKYGTENRETMVMMKTPKGTIKIKLYENTPLHRANFIRLIKNDFYKGTMFYRVINHFMIQGGDSDDWERQTIKQKMGSYTLPAEINKENIHKKGALSMAREYENNPEKRSVSFEFFIVQGTKYTDGELLGAQQQYKLNISPENKTIYKTLGGTPHLDGQHTVFGQVIEGFEVIDTIAATKVDEGNWPIENITLDFEILK